MYNLAAMLRFRPLPTRSGHANFGIRCSKRTEEVDTKEGGVGRRPKRDRHRKRQQLDAFGAITLSLADLVYGDPPWQLRKGARLCEVGLQRFLPGVLLEEEAHADASVEVALRVEPVGLGFYIRGRASADVTLACGACMAPCSCEVNSKFEALLSREERAVDDVGDNEIPWPLHMQSVDITEVIAEALSSELPLEVKCINGCLNRNAMVEDEGFWRSTGTSTAGSEPKGSLSDLARLKARLEG